MLTYQEIRSPIGPLTLVFSDIGLCRIDFGEWDDVYQDVRKWSKRYFSCTEFSVSHDYKVEQQLVEYFSGKRKTFTFTIDLKGTAFQQKVWTALLKTIPYGETKSYKDIANTIHSPKAVRAVGGAVNKNPIAILVPCHRVIGSNGDLVGYDGGLDKKQFLLSLEKGAS